MAAYIIPNEIAQEVEDIVNAARRAAEQQGLSLQNSIQIARPQTKEVVPGAVETVLFVLGSGAVWFTKKWFDTFVWPSLETRIRKPSQKAVDFIFKNLDARSRSGASPGG